MRGSPPFSWRWGSSTVSGVIEYKDGCTEQIGPETLVRVPEAALRALTLAVFTLALLAVRLQ